MTHLQILEMAYALMLFTNVNRAEPVFIEPELTEADEVIEFGIKAIDIKYVTYITGLLNLTFGWVEGDTLRKTVYYII